MHRPESVTDPVTVTPAVLRGWPLPAAGSDKHARGSVGVVGGTETTPGAVLLAGEASLRAGAGKLAMATASGVAGTLAVSVPESKVVGLVTDDAGNLDASAAGVAASALEGVDAVLLGSGFTDPVAAVTFSSALMPHIETPLVLDALGSAFLTDHPDGVRRLDGLVVLSVNPMELSRCAGVDEDEVKGDAYPAAARVARDSGVVVLCGGEVKVVVTPDGRHWRIEGGGPGLGVSGSGDVQAGVVAGLLARCGDPAQAAVWAAYLHARCGERLAADLGQLGYLARELPREVTKVLAELG